MRFSHHDNQVERLAFQGEGMSFRQAKKKLRKHRLKANNEASPGQSSSIGQQPAPAMEGMAAQ